MLFFEKRVMKMLLLRHVREHLVRLGMQIILQDINFRIESLLKYLIQVRVCALLHAYTAACTYSHAETQYTCMIQCC